MMIEITIDNAWGRIVGLPAHLKVAVDQVTSFDIKGAEMSALYRKGRWDGKKRLFDKQTGKYPAGLHNRIMRVIRAHGDEYRITDMRKNLVRSKKKFELLDAAEPRPYQEEAVEIAQKADRGILQVATGGGKTIIASKLITEVNAKTIFLVHTKDLLYQAKESFEETIGGTKIGQLGDGVIDIQDITVATVQTVAMFLNVKVEEEDKDEIKMEKSQRSQNADKVIEFIESVGLLIFDECHRVASESAYTVCGAITNAPMRIGLSASPFRDDGAEMMIEASLGDVIYEISASFLIEQGYLVEPIIRMVRIPASIDPSNDTRTYEQIYRDEIVNNDYRNRQVLKYAEDFMNMDIPTLVLVQQIGHGKKLKKLITEEYHPIEFISGSDFTQKRLQAIEEMREGDRLAMIASVIADEGLDIKRLAGLIIAGGGKSSTRALQRIGRVLRPFEGKTHALVVDFMDEAKFLHDHSQERRKHYSKEPRFIILEL